MMRYVLSITELAKLKNITSETLRYYDRIGLLKPEFMAANGYRQYSIRQYERLGTILELREIGMSISEIQEYLNNRNFHKSISILEDYQKKYENKLLEMQRLNDELKQKLDFLKNLQELPQTEKIFEMDFPTRYMVTLRAKCGDREEHAMAFTVLENYIKERIPIIASDRVGIFADERLLIPSEELIPGVPMLLVSPENAVKQYMEEIPEGKYVCIYYRNGILEKYDPSFEKVKAYINENGYEINGNILQLYKVDVTLTDNPEETILELQVPVREK